MPGCQEPIEPDRKKQRGSANADQGGEHVGAKGPGVASFCTSGLAKAGQQCTNALKIGSRLEQNVRRH